jgi:hypothetical protein
METFYVQAVRVNVLATGRSNHLKMEILWRISGVQVKFQEL